MAGKLTINGGTIGDGRDGVRIENGNLTVNGGTMDFLYGSNSGTVTITGGTVKNAQCAADFEITVTGGSGHTGLWNVSEGTWNISGGEFGDVTFLTALPAKNASINGGTFEKITRQILKPGGNSEEVPAPLSGLLADGYAFYWWITDSGEYDRYVSLDDTTTYLDNVQVKPHTHTITGNNNVCTECGKEFAASVTQNGAVTYYEDFNAALSAAKAGDTLTLLTDVRSDAALVAIDKAIILDLNGYNIPGLEVEAKATIKDSGEPKGTISTLSVPGNGLTFGDLLEPGYAFRTANAWCIETEEGVASNVTVQQAPITSVTLTALNADNTAASTTIPYGTTGGIKLFAHCDPKPGVTELSCQWYTIGDSAVLIEGAKGTEYNLPDNLSVGEHTYRVTFTADGYTKSADITITVAPADLSQEAVVFTQTADEFAGTMGNIEDGKGTFVFTPYGGSTASPTELSYLFEVSCNGRNLTADSDYTVTGGSTAKWAGTYTLTIEGRGNYTGTATHQWEIKPYTLSKNLSVGRIDRDYDGTTNLSAEELIELGCFIENLENRNSKNPLLGADQGSFTIRLGAEDFEVSNVKLGSAEVGDTTASCTIKLKPRPGQTAANFVFEDGTSEMTVKEVPVSTAKAFLSSSPKAGKLNVANDHAGVYTLDLSKLLPKLESPKKYGAVTYEISEIKLDDRYYTSGVKVENGKLILPILAVKTSTESNIGTVKVKVTSGNIVDFPLLINVDATNKIVPTGAPTLSKTTLAWGEQLSTITLSGTMTDPTDSTKTVKGKFEWVDGTVKPNAGSYEAAWKFTPTDGDTYTEADGTVSITVNKAKPTGDPIYTRITAANKTLKDAALKPNTSWPTGTIQWVDKDGKELPDTTEVKANTAYKWIFTPGAEFAANYTTATGELTLYSVSTGGGGGSSSDRDTSSSGTVKTETTKNNDGSVTKTETKKDGTVIETTTGKDGSTVKTTTNPNGSSVTETKAADGSTGTVKTDKNGQTTAETKVSAKAVEDAKKNGEAVKAPVEVKASRDSSTAPIVKVELPKGAGETKVEIPVTNVKPGTVAVLVHADGTEEIVKNSLPTEDGIQLTVNGGATVKIVDNSKDFADTQNHWAKDAIDFVSARELVNGMNDSIYAPNASTTRAQLWTILARQNDADLTGGANWYEKAQLWSKDKGISDGTQPDAAINRAQVVTMLWRAEGQPAAGGNASFADVPADSYYAQAVAWAVEGGITAGVGGGRFDPNSTCTRAQIATFLWRAMAE